MAKRPLPTARDRLRPAGPVSSGPLLLGLLAALFALVVLAALPLEGAPAWWRRSAWPIVLVAAGGAVIAMALIWRGMRAAHRRHAQEQETLAQMERYRDVADSVPGAIFQYRTTPGGSAGFTYISGGIRSLTGHCPQRLLESAAGLLALIHPDDRAILEARADRARQAAMPLGIDVRLDLDGGWRWVRIDMLPRTTVDGAVLWNGMVRDVTPRKQAEQALAEASRRTEGILCSMVDAVIAIDAVGRIEMVNPAAEAMFGYPAMDLIGRDIAMLMPEPYRSEHGTYLRTYRQSGVARIIGLGRDVVGARRDGSEFPLHLGISEMQSNGRPLYIGTMRDITAQKQVEQALQSAKDEAEAANQAKSRFLATMSHELRTPLNAIIGFSDLIRRRMFGGDIALYASYAEEIHRSGSHLLDVISDILDMSRIEAETIRLSETVVSLAPLVDRCRGMMAGRAAEAGLTLQAVLSPDLPRLWADERAMRQILLNLLANAIKFTPQGGRVEITAGPEPDGGVRLAVGDTGIGIPDEAQERVFLPFQQADMSVVREHGGTGLGLSICRALAQAHGGRLEMESRVTVGTVVSLILPPERVIREPYAAPMAGAGYASGG